MKMPWGQLALRHASDVEHQTHQDYRLQTLWTSMRMQGMIVDAACNNGQQSAGRHEAATEVGHGTRLPALHLQSSPSSTLLQGPH